MILTRRFGTLRARQTFPSIDETDAREQEAPQATADTSPKAGSKVHHLFKGGHTGVDKKHIA